MAVSALAIVALINHQRTEHGPRSLSWEGAADVATEGHDSSGGLGVSRQSVVRFAAEFHETWADSGTLSIINVTPPYRWTVQNMLGIT